MERVITARSIFGVISAALFVITKIFIVQGVLLLVIIDQLQLSRMSAIILIVVTTIPCLWLAFKGCMMCYLAETDPINQ